MRGGRAVAPLMLGLTLSACTAGASTPVHHHAGAVAAVEAGADLGNDRPLVSYDGLMVRRRVVLAVRCAPAADLSSVRRRLQLAAAQSHQTLTPVSPSVLDPNALERLAPDLAVALGAGATRADGQHLMDVTFGAGHRIGAPVRAYVARSALVHDLRFTVTAAHPAAVSRAIAREGILSDALGNYATLLGARRLAIVYTGPLLSDHLLTSVRRGIARAVHGALEQVSVSPRSSTGSGVDMSTAPAAPDDFSATTGHHHHHGR